MGILIENRSPTTDTVAFFENMYTADILVPGFVLDTLDFPAGITFVPVRVGSAIEVNTFSFALEEDDDEAMSNPNFIDDDRLVGSLSDIEITSNILPGDFLNAIGVFNTKRFIRILVSAESDTEAFSIIVYARGTNNNQAVVNDVIIV